MTWGQLKTKFQQISGDTSAATLVQAESDMNTGNRRFNAALNNYFTRRSKAASIVADQQYYQLPPDCIRVMEVDFLESASRRLPLTQVRSEYQWRTLNNTSQGGNHLVYWFQKGADEIGVFPIPTEAVSSGLILAYEPRGAKLSQADYSDGTIALTNGSNTVTGTGTTFTSNMVGRTLEVTDGSDGYSYRIASYTSGTVLTLEEPFIGISGSGKTYLIGESPLFPEEFHDAPLDFALSRFFEMNNNPERAKYHSTRYKEQEQEAKEMYASSSSSQVIILDPQPGYNYWADNTVQVGE